MERNYKVLVTATGESFDDLKDESRQQMKDRIKDVHVTA